MVKRKRIRCKDYKCKKDFVDTNTPIGIQTGDAPMATVATVFPCNACGRLHWFGGSPVQTDSGYRRFWKEGRTYHIDRKGKEY